MNRTFFRSLPRFAERSASYKASLTHGRRFVSTSPPHLRSRSWKSSALRWGVAFAGIYYYNTSPVFAEHPENNLLNPNVDALEDDREPSLIDTLTASSRNKAQKDASVLQSSIETTSMDDAMNSTTHPATDIPVTNASPAELEEEAEGQGAFNPETGEINWDCPCLGGMAHGPCGPQFREAFSCFVYSTEEPKGMNCIDKFQNMQNCFREHPEVYKGELEDDEELDAELAQEKEELTTQIAQRRAADRDSEKRLLEEPSPAPYKKKAPKKATSDQSSPATSPKKQPKSQVDTKTASSSEPHPGMSEEHGNIHEGQSSVLYKQPNPPSIDVASSTGNQTLVPKAAHDARST